MKASRAKPRRPLQVPPRVRKTSAAPVAAPSLLDVRLGVLCLGFLVLVPPFLMASNAKESFRQPKLLASEWFALASLVCLAWGLRRVEKVRLADCWRLRAVRLAVPFLAVATVGLVTTRHPAQTREALADLWIGAACLVGWSAALPAARLERLLRALLWPAAGLAVIGICQFHGLWQPLEFLGLVPGSRLAITSRAGNPGDLGAYLVLPVLIGQEQLARRLRQEGWRRPAMWGTVAALALCLYALLLTQTLAAVVAVLAGSLLLWGALLPRRRTVVALAVGTALAALVIAAVPPLRQRLIDKGRQAAQGDLNAVLTGRLDGWRTAVWMLQEQPITGVGHGAYRAEYVPAKLALLARGVTFFPGQTNVNFINAHNEILEVGADLGIPGLLALGWGLWVLVGALRRATGPPQARALIWAGTAALALLSLAYFPFRVALVGFPALLFLSWVLRAAEEAA